MSGREQDNPYDNLGPDSDYQSGNPYRKFNFTVVIEGGGDGDDGRMAIAGFQEVSGLEMEIEPETYEEGGRHGQPHKLPGTVSYSDLTLKRGLTNSTKLFDWIGDVRTALTGPSKNLDECKRKVWVELRSAQQWDDDGETKSKGTWAWQFSNAYPVGWSGPDMDAMSSDGIAIQELTITHGGFSKSSRE